MPTYTLIPHPENLPQVSSAMRQAKTILVPGAQAAEVVAKGEVELGVAQGSEIVPVASAQLVGPLPGEFASISVFTAGIGAGSKSPDSALTGPDAAARFKAKGFEPGCMPNGTGHRKKDTAT